MRPDIYLRSSAAKLALTYMAMFVLSVSLLGVVTYTTLQRSMESRLEEGISAELAQLLVDYQEDGIRELRHDIEERIEGSPNERYLYFLKDAQGKMRFDAMTRWPEQEGLQRVWHADGEEIMLRTHRLDDGYMLGIGADREHLLALRRAMQQNFGVALACTMLIGLLGSVVIGRRFRARVEAFHRTAERVGAGALGERLPLSGSRDDFDDLAVSINGMLERIERLVGSVRRVTASVAHDMRTPLGRIRHRLEELREEHPALDEELDEVIVQLDESLAMFAAILSIADVESSMRRERFTRVDLSALLSGLAETYAPVVEDEGVRFEIELAEDVAVRGDEELLMQAFANLIENALTHAQAEKITLFLNVLSAGEVCAGVRDDGVGIARPEELARITEPFFRLDRSRSSPGHGLGLSLVDAIAVLHGASLHIASREPGLEVGLRLTRA